MKHVVFAALAVVCLWCPAPALAQSAEKVQTVDISRLIPQDKPFFAKVGERWEATYKGTSRPTIIVTIMGIKEGDDDLVLLQTTLGNRNDIPLSRNLAVKLLELSGDWDFAKVVLYNQFVAIRLDHPMAGLNPVSLEKLCDAVASATDIALGEIKNFLP
jgi:hypothetical protein